MNTPIDRVLRYRIWMLLFFFLLISAVIISRLFFLQVVKYNFFKQKTVAQQQKTIKIMANRGTIYDRNHKVLATSVETLSIYATPKYIKNKEELAKTIAVALKKPYADVFKTINNDQFFVWLERKMDPEKANELKRMKLPGIGFVPEQKRVYPRKDYAAHLLGFVGVDDTGLSGIEQYYDKVLGGEPGQLIVERTPYGDEIYCGLRTVKPPIHGADLVLTIDEYIQFVAEKNLKNAIKQTKSKAGSIIVMDPKTGEILALACSPDFDPNDPGKSRALDRVNTTIQTVYEPGSTLKPLTLAGAYEEKSIDDATRIYNGVIFSVGNKKIVDYHAARALNLNTSFSPEDILTYSLNIGTAKIGLLLGKTKLFSCLKNFGLGAPTGIELSGESGGILRPVELWDKADDGRIPFGQGVAVTPIQLICAINALGNGGMLTKPALLQKIVKNNNKVIQENIFPQNRKRVVSASTAERILEMMRRSVDKGTGIAAKLVNYSVAGKTGTAEKADQFGGGYIANEYVASFVGLVPAHQPRFSILVVLDTPRIGEFGGTVAAPVFKNVAEAILYYWNVSPDRAKTLSSAFTQ